jgi:hypothetical protein
VLTVLLLSLISISLLGRCRDGAAYDRHV